MGSGEPYETKSTDRDEFYSSYLNLTSNEIEQIAHQPEDMIKHCRIQSKFGEEQCNALRKGKYKMFTAVYGMCYMFNYVGVDNPYFRINEEQAIKSNYGGPEFGLDLIIDMESRYQGR